MTDTTDTAMLDFLSNLRFEFEPKNSFMAYCELQIDDGDNFFNPTIYEGDTFRDCIREAMNNG